MIRRFARATVLFSIVLLVLGLSTSASDAQLLFSSDKNGQSRLTDIQEGDEIWIVVIDNDENIDCDVRDKMGPDIKIMDPKTGAYIVWEPDADEGWADEDFLEETGPDTGVFVSNRAFQVGTRESFAGGDPAWQHTHVVDLPDANGVTDDFMWGHYWYGGPWGGDTDNRGWISPGPGYNAGLMVPGGWPGVAVLPSKWTDSAGTDEYLIGRFENMDTLIGMYQDPNDAADVAIGLMKIIDTEATISWDQEIYKDADGAATITVVDPDENVNCNEVEAVPVFILVNPGSWNPMDADPGNDEGGKSPTNFCMLLGSGGVSLSMPGTRFVGGVAVAPVVGESIRWYNIYNGDNPDHLYYIQYDPARFATANSHGITAVLFYAWETGRDTGVFQLNLNRLDEDLGFDELYVRDVLVAYYLDPNDFDDFKLSTATIEERRHSVTSFTDANRAEKELYWIGRDPVYVQVIDANANVDPCCPEQAVVHLCDLHGEDDSEWIVLDETSSNSPVFFTFSGYQLRPVWDALGAGLVDLYGGFQLQLDNWKLEVFNEDEVYARYNDQYYGAPSVVDTLNGLDNDVSGGLGTLGDSNIATSFPPWITRWRVGNDVSFGLMSIADRQVFDGSTTQMYFLDRQGGRVSAYASSDCVFVEVIDPDQDEDQARRERIDGYWDGGQNVPFGPQALNEFRCGELDSHAHYVNRLLGDTNIFNDSPTYSLYGECLWWEDHPTLDFPDAGWAKLYVLNPRNGRWAAVDLLETGVATGEFVSVVCIDLIGVYECVPTLAVRPGDTIVAFYQDPSNHSDSAMISIRVGIGGAGTPPGQASTTTFVDADGDAVSSYTDADPVYVKVVDPSHVGDALLANALEIDGDTYDLTLWYDVQTYAAEGTFVTEALDLDLTAGESLTATYTDPADPMDTSSATVPIVAGVLDVDRFYAGPSPFDGTCLFGYIGTGVASVMSVEVYDLAGTIVWASERLNVTEIVWDGTTGAPCSPVANGGYVYVVSATDGTSTFTGTGTVFVSR